VGQSAFPRLAAHAESCEWPEYRRTITRALLALPALAALLLLGRRVIALIFERGRFDAAAGDLTFTLLAVYPVALPFYVATEVLTRGLTALRDTRTPLATNTVQIIGRAALLVLLVPRLGVVAIPLAFALTSALEALVRLLLRRHRRGVQGYSPCGPAVRRQRRARGGELGLCARRSVSDLPGLAQGIDRFVNGQENRRFNRAKCTPGTNCQHNRGHGHVVRGLPQVVAVVRAKGVPEPVELPADRLDVGLSSLSAILWIADQPGPRLRGVAELREVERHRLPPSRN
jgi:hypothetical protein